MKKLKNKLLSIFMILSLSYSNILYSSANTDSLSYDYDKYLSYSNYEYYIKNMNVNVEVNDKREFIITEEIDAYFNWEKRGIIRMIPLNSSLEKVKIKNISVEGDKYSTHKENNSLNIRIGDENIFLRGDKKYIIKYTLKHYDDGEKDGDYLYLNVLGDDWDVPVLNFKATINYPESFKFEDINVTSGYKGSIDNLYADYSVGKNVIEITSKDSIPSFTGITVNARFEDGAFKNAPMDMTRYIFYSIIMINYGLLLLTIILILKTKSRIDNIIKPVEFYPPEDIRPLEMGYLYCNEITTEMVVSCIYKWASDGYIKIEMDSKKKITLIKIKELSDVPAFEFVLFREIFACGSGIPRKVTESQLKYELSDTFDTVIDSVKDKYAKDERYKKKNPISRIYITLAAIILSMLTCGYATILNMDATSFSLAVLAMMLILGTIGILIRDFVEYDYNISLSENILNILKAIFMLAFMLVVYLFFNIFFLGNFNVLINIISIIPLFASLILCEIIEAKKSPYEEEIYGRICGFKDFLEHAEKDKLEMLLEEDPDYFYKILPYAQVLDVTDIWTDKFENIDVKPSENYGYNTRIHNYNSLSRSLNRTFASASSIKPAQSSGVSTSRSRGGFSGGGFSGGGSGGGGGRSW